MIAATERLFGAGIARQPMKLVKARIIAPDSSHWAKWVDAALSSDPSRRAEGACFHDKLLDAGRIPLLSWHHLEELLSIEDETRARERVGFIQSLPVIAFMRLPFDDVGLGAITDILAAEALIATDNDCDAVFIRDQAKEMLLRTGSGAEAIGDEGWVWEVARHEFRERNARSKEIMAIKGVRLFDDERTIGEIAKGSIRPQQELATKAEEVQSRLLSGIRKHGDRRMTGHEGVAANFMADAMAWQPPAGMSVRELLVTALTAQGVDEEEIRDDRLLSELNWLAIFRTQLRVVAPKTGKSFDELKRVPMERLPSWLIEHALKVHGQKRTERKGSDLNDSYLATLAAYTDQLYVDKRTAEDFRRATSKDPGLSQLIGGISKAAGYADLLS